MVKMNEKNYVPIPTSPLVEVHSYGSEQIWNIKRFPIYRVPTYRGCTVLSQYFINWNNKRKMSVKLAAKLDKKSSTLSHAIILCPGHIERCHLEYNNTSLGGFCHFNFISI